MFEAEELVKKIEKVRKEIERLIPRNLDALKDYEDERIKGLYNKLCEQIEKLSEETRREVLKFLTEEELEIYQFLTSKLEEAENDLIKCAETIAVEKNVDRDKFYRIIWNLAEKGIIFVSLRLT